MVYSITCFFIDKISRYLLLLFENVVNVQNAPRQVRYIQKYNLVRELATYSTKRFVKTYFL